MKTGFVTYWFERGQAYVTKNVIQAIQDDCDVFVFARSAGILKTDGEWAIPNLTTHDQYQIPKHVLRKWITDNDLDVVFFNEEYDLGLVFMAKDMGVKTVGIYYWELFDPGYVKPCNTAYDAIICPTKCNFEKFKSFGMANIHYIKWGVDLDVFKPAIREPNEKVRFFHPAGWGGMHNRRGTEFVLQAIKAMDADAELLIHTQRDQISLEQQNGITLVSGTVSREELICMYQESDVAVLPSKWEGLGLTFLEAIGCGLPIITVAAPPMTEFVDYGETENSQTGYCCKVRDIEKHKDIFVSGMIPDVEDLARQMDMMTDRYLLEQMRNATIFRRSEWDWRENSQELRNLILELGGKTGTSGTVSLDTISALIQAECSPGDSVEIDTREYARFHKICADPMIRGDVLDIGCKHGTLAMMLSEKFEVVGVDKSVENIEIAESLALTKPIYGDSADDLQFQQAEIQSLPFEDESFDTVILAQVIEHLRDPEDLKELMRVLRPDGCLIITTNVGFAHWDPDHQWFFLPDKTYEMLRGGWFFMEQNGEPAFMKQGTVVPFGAFIEKYTGLSYDYQVYNNHDNPHHSLEIYARVYKNDAMLIPFPEIPGDEIIEEQILSTDQMRSAGVI